MLLICAVRSAATSAGRVAVTVPRTETFVGGYSAVSSRDTTRVGMLDRISPRADSVVGVILRAAIPLELVVGRADTVGVVGTTKAGTYGVMTLEAALAAEFSAWVMNARTTGMGEYTNFEFTSLFRVGTTCYGISGGKLYLLAGKTDDGDPIDAEILTGVSDLNIARAKTATDVFLELRCDGEMTTSVQYNEDTPIEYVDDCDTGGKLMLRRVELGLGAEGSHVQFGLKNVDGSDFTVQSMQIRIAQKSRRT